MGKRRLAAADVSPGVYICRIGGLIRRARIVELVSQGVWRAVCSGSGNETFLTLRDVLRRAGPARSRDGRSMAVPD